MPSPINEADLTAALPDVTSSFSFAGLDGPITIHRDEWGIPHIKAGSEHDAFFGQGFVTAQDRLWHMDCDRHRALGRWAEWGGPGALKEDRLMRRLSLERASKADLAASRPDAQAMVQALTDGINAFIDTTKTLPIEYKLLDEAPERWDRSACLLALLLCELAVVVEVGLNQRHQDLVAERVERLKVALVQFEVYGHLAGQVPDDRAR